MPDHYGPELSWQAFNTSLLLAYVYPFLLFVLAYSYFGGSHLFSGQPLFPEQTPWRGVYFPGLLLFGLVIFLVVKVFIGNSDAADDWGKRQLQRLSGVSPQVAHYLWQGGMGLGAALISWFWLSPGSIGWGLIWSVLGYLYGAFAVAVAVAVAVIGIIQENYDRSLLFAFFYLALPVLNASLDFLSWWVSRYFLQLTLVTQRLWLILAEILIDGVLALVFLLLLCLVLPPAAMGLDSLYALWVNEQGFSAHTGWQNLAYAAARDPWGEGVMVTGMLLSTLLPTALHLILGLTAYLIYGLHGERLAGVLERTADGHRFRFMLVSLWLYLYAVLAIGLIATVVWGFYQLWQLPIAEWLYRFTYFWFGDYGMVPLP